MSGCVRHLPPAIPNPACHQEPERKRERVKEGRRIEGGAQIQPKGRDEEKITRAQRRKEESISVEIMKSLKEEGGRERRSGGKAGREETHQIKVKLHHATFSDYLTDVSCLVCLILPIQ